MSSADNMQFDHSKQKYLPVREIELPEATKLAEYEMIVGELRLAKETLEVLDDVESNRVKFRSPSKRSTAIGSLLQAATLAYCRCFDPTRQLRLTAVEIFGEENAGLLVHEQVWNLRSKHYAHDVNGFRNSVVGVGVTSDGLEFEIVRARLHTTFGSEHLGNIRLLVTRALEFALASASHHYAETVQKMEQMTPEERLLLKPVSFPDSDLKSVAESRRKAKRTPTT